MTQSARDSIYEAIASIRLIDPHTHINPHSPASTTLADILGYHYYTELAHSAECPSDRSKRKASGLANWCVALSRTSSHREHCQLSLAD